jgi:serine/threonine-protein kinase
LTPTRLGKYELLYPLGRGGYGTVYRAHDMLLNVERAIKVLHPPLVADPEFLERFRREAQTAARLEHPHIVPVYDLGEESGSVFLAMRLMPGGSAIPRANNAPLSWPRFWSKPASSSLGANAQILSKLAR